MTGYGKTALSAVVLALLISIAAAGCGRSALVSTDVDTEEPADGKEPGAVYGDQLKDGVYPIQAESSSSMFRITECELTVEDGRMSARMTMGGTGYLKLYMGSGTEAEKASEQECIPYEEDSGGVHTFTIPVEALDVEISCSAYSKRKEKWYDRELIFYSASLPSGALSSGGGTTVQSLGLEDGHYTAEVALEGGSGRASVESLAALQVENGEARATIIWGSSNYDYMIVDDQRFECSGDGKASVFEIPVRVFDERIPVLADTTAMGMPHEIAYTLTFDSESIKRADAGLGSGASASVRWADLKPVGSMDLLYADQFSVDYYENGYVLATIRDSGRYLAVPDGAAVPEGLPEDVTALCRPLDQIYLAATSAMDLFRSLEAVDQITLSGTDAPGWYIDEAKKAMEDGRMLYAGKYSAPDYERLLQNGCDLAVESTMIYHVPEVKEQLERLGIPVLVERSSYESHPLGRMEWIRLYGALLGRDERAEACFTACVDALKPLMDQPSQGKTVAFFYISKNGAVNVRKPGDYVANMIEMAGGRYVPAAAGEEENALSSVNMQMEAFYASARDADYIIYNSTIDGELDSLADLLKKNGLLADFKAVNEGHVWCTGKNLFQESMGLGDMVLDIHRMMNSADPDPGEMAYLYPLK